VYIVQDLIFTCMSLHVTTKPNLSRQLLTIVANEGLAQIQEDPTRGDSILDLYFTNRPGLIKNSQSVPGIGDHDMCVIDTDLKAKINKSHPRKIFQFNKAEWDTIRKEAEILNQHLISHFANDINENWVNFKSRLDTIITKNVPSNLSSTRHNLPWLDCSLKKLLRRKKRLFKKAKTSKCPIDFANYKTQKKTVQSKLKSAHDNYINNILVESLQSKDTKPFWRYIKQRRQDSTGIAPIKSDGKLVTDNKGKAELINKHFQSVFTKDDNIQNSRLVGEPSPPIDSLEITESGVADLLKNLKVNKASGPDNIPNRVLKEIATEIAPFMTKLFQHSVNTGTLPKEWTTANIAPIFKKGNRHEAANYRPVSLTCVCCKLLEHIICRHLMDHLEKHNILTHLQHGFRSGHSCETQLLLTTHDILQQYDGNTQVDLAILDFSKAFDTVPHKRLLRKLSHYGIRGELNNWIGSFLTDRQQSVIIEGIASGSAEVLSGVPQGTVLGPILFLCHINDLPLSVKSRVRMFADDCLLYSPIRCYEDHLKLQSDLVALDEWAAMWGMRFNAKKCYVMRISRKRNPSSFIYTLSNHPLEQVSQNPYLGVLLSENLKWAPHIDQLTKKANKTLGFLRRNLHMCSGKIKETAYKTLVQPLLAYSSTI
jgi:hypothetical protein